MTSPHEREPSEVRSDTKIDFEGLDKIYSAFISATILRRLYTSVMNQSFIISILKTARENVRKIVHYFIVSILPTILYPI